jgi:3-hydroxyisobutyrate dehydrogenase-like beta-hydroxyacid dehydrogenase
MVSCSRAAGRRDHQHGHHRPDGAAPPAPKLKEKGVDLLDSPVTGMEKGAIEGTLNAYVGGDAAALERVRPVLASMATKITHFGPIGQGLAMKLINNMLFQVNRVLIIEGMALGAKAGLDPQQMFDTISGTTGNSVAFQYSAPRILNREFDGIRMDITFKDVELQTSWPSRWACPCSWPTPRCRSTRWRAPRAWATRTPSPRFSCTKSGPA